MPHEGRSGFRLLPNSTEAFMARAELIRNARTSLDLQYYIVHDGLSTRALIDELLKAADRGVRVRILLDDTTSDGLDQAIATLAAHNECMQADAVNNTATIKMLMAQLAEVNEENRGMRQMLHMEPK